MGDGSAIGGWILAAAVIAVLGGAAAGAGGSSGGSGGSGTSGTSTTSATASAPPPTPHCTRVSKVVSTDGKHYKQFPVSASGSVNCRLTIGDHGHQVTVLQQALLMCSNRTVTIDSTYSENTAGALARDQHHQLALKPTGVYDGATAQIMRWPWYDTATNTFTGRCGNASGQTV